MMRVQLVLLLLALASCIGHVSAASVRNYMATSTAANSLQIKQLTTSKGYVDAAPAPASTASSDSSSSDGDAYLDETYLADSDSDSAQAASIVPVDDNSYGGQCLEMHEVNVCLQEVVRRDCDQLQDAVGEAVQELWT